MKIHYRVVFISDTHLGFSGANVAALLKFLKSITCDTLYIVGDFLDIWEMHRSMKYWSPECAAVIGRLMKMAKSGTKIIYIPGNHDEAVREHIPLDFSENIMVLDSAIYVSPAGVEYLVIHGDQVDSVINNMKFIAKFGNVLYGWLIYFNTHVHSLRTWLGYNDYWSLSGFLKRKAKSAMSFVADFELAMTKLAEAYGHAGVICGHIHTAKIEGLYVNCGDWVESLTAVVENDNGELEIIKG